MHKNPLLAAVLKLAEEDLRDKYYACLPDESNKIKLLALAIRRHRWKFGRAFPKPQFEVIVLEGLEKYLESKGVEEFREALEKVIRTEDMEVQEKKLPQGESVESSLHCLTSVSKEYGMGVSTQREVTVKLHEGLGDIRLGKLRQQYITDLDIRHLLEQTVLNTKKMPELFGDHKLLLITSVISSDKLEAAGTETEGAFTLQSEGSAIPPGVATRKTPGPLLFKCCRVTYNKENRRLEIPKEEYIDKTVYTNRYTQPAPEKQKGENHNTFVKSSLDATDSQELTDGEYIGKRVYTNRDTQPTPKEQKGEYEDTFVKSSWDATDPQD